jgi:Kef-type K+ transport system membrane component KefB/mannitol/fructose-specific phosphotransferase system IIA component (Ntr-type)/nucleotide-binding universal stress UspA family protein
MEITNPVLMFAFIMAIVLAAPVVFERIRLPGVVGLIVAGIVVGPHALGILKSEESFQLFSSVGLIYIMFLAGLEINLNEFSRQKKNSIVFGALTFLIPMFIGTIGSKYLFTFSWPTAVLLASMFASHTLIPFPITTNLGINRERSVISTVGATIFTDTAALLVLAIIVERATAELTAAFWVRQVFLLLILIWFALWLLPRLAYFLFKMFAPDGAREFLLTLSLVFLTAYFAHLANVEPIIGAFFAGLSLTRLIPEQSPLKNRLEFVGNTFFIPFFLISVGMLVNFRAALGGWDVWAVAGFMILTAIFCKYAAAFITAKILKFNSDERNLIFGLSVNQAAATLAAVVVGLRLGIFNNEILNGTILMILVTCLIGPWITEKYGQRVAQKRHKAIEPGEKSDEKIVIAVDRGESAEFLTDVALNLRAEDSKEPIVPLYVVQDGVDIDRRIVLGEKLLGAVVNRIVAANVPVSPISRIDVSISGGILRVLKEYHADVLVLGARASRKLNFRTMFFDISDRVCDGSRQLILLCQISHPLNIGKNLFVFIPPMLQYREGFKRSLGSIKNLATKNKLNLRFIGMPETIEGARKAFPGKGMAVEPAFLTVNEWKGCSEYLRNSDIKEADSIILMAARKGHLGWNPSLKRSFHDLSSEFTGSNIMMLYVPDIDWDQVDYEAGYRPQDLEALALLTRPAVEINGKNMEDAIDQLLAAQFPSESKIHAEVIKKLFPLEPIELSSGIVLFHIHSRHVSEPVILLGISPGGIVFTPLPKKIKAFFILISPKDETSAHLQALTKVARMTRDLQNSKGMFSPAASQ